MFRSTTRTFKALTPPTAMPNSQLGLIVSSVLGLYGFLLRPTGDVSCLPDAAATTRNNRISGRSSRLLEDIITKYESTKDVATSDGEKIEAFIEEQAGKIGISGDEYEYLVNKHCS